MHDVHGEAGRDAAEGAQGMSLIAPTLEEQAACLRRELGLRKRVYPNWVASKKMSAAKAEREIETMEAALATIEYLVAATSPPGGKAA